jgi:iron uptake system component EfeO
MKRLACFLAACALAACSDKTDDDYAREVVSGMRAQLTGDLDAMVAGATLLCAAAPTGHGWDATADAAAIAAMKDAWVSTRVGYEPTEGALAPIFPDIDFSIDARYDDFLTELGSDGDTDAFDGAGVTGMHAIERILYAPETPAHVVEFEKVLPGYRPAAYPSTAAEAAAFKTGLCQKLVDDATLERQQWQGATGYDLGAAFQGLIGLMNEQREKVNKAATSEEESRYSQRTMADLRDNLDGSRKIYALFAAWIVSKPGGDQVDADIVAGFAQLETLYTAVSGDLIPQPPATWSSENPSAADLMTPFGQLYSGVRAAVDPSRKGSVVERMNEAAVLMGFPAFQE